MKDTLNLAIEYGEYKLDEMKERIDHFYASGKLSKDEHANLVEQAEGNAPAGPADSERLSALETLCAGLSARIAALEEHHPADRGPVERNPEPEPFEE